MHLADQAELIRLRKEIEQLRMEREIIKKASCLLCQGNWIKYGVIREQQKTYPVTVL
jgi:transposase-like protein